MAGFYPDVPAPRLAWDRDGTVFVHLDTNNNYQSDYTDKATYNSETIGTRLKEGWACFIFPQHMNIVGYTVRRDAASSDRAIMTSVDSTNGADGTWIQRGQWSNTSGSKDVLRDIIPVDWPGVKAVKFLGTYKSGSGLDRHLANIHLYGAPADPETFAAGLQIWHPDLYEPIGPAHLDWGDVPRGSSDDRQFRVINRKNGWIAKDVTVSAEALTDTTPSVVGQHLFSLDGENFESSVDLGDLEPSQPSPVITVRRNIATDAALGLWWARIIASADSWIPEPE